MKHSMEQLPALLKRLHRVVGDLEKLFPGRHFTPDGHLVGSLGEVWAAYLYGIKLSPASERTHDGSAPGGRLVQVKATYGHSVALRSKPKFLVVLRLDVHGQPEEVYSGPGTLPWKHAGPLQSNGQRRIALSKLRVLAAAVRPANRIPRVGAEGPER